MVSTFVTSREANDQMEFFEPIECTQFMFILIYRLCFVRKIMFFYALISVNISSVMLGRVFLSCTSTKQRSMCLAQGHNTVTLPVVRLELATLPAILRQEKFIWAQQCRQKLFVDMENSLWLIILTSYDICSIFYIITYSALGLCELLMVISRLQM